MNAVDADGRAMAYDERAVIGNMSRWKRLTKRRVAGDNTAKNAEISPKETVKTLKEVVERLDKWVLDKPRAAFGIHGKSTKMKTNDRLRGK